MAKDEEEGRRQAYLAALCIPLWSPRHPLPGAQPSVPLDFVPWLHGEAAPEVAQTPAEPEPQPAAVRGPALASHAAPVSTKPAEPLKVVAKPASGDQEQFPRFICRVQTLAPGWSAVVTMGDAPDLSAREHRLLGNLAQALGGDVTDMQPCEHLRWPLNRNPALDHSAGAMVEWLSHALRLPHGRCVVFGEVLASHVRAALPHLVVIAAPFLSELLDDPVRKRELWRSLHG